MLIQNVCLALALLVANPARAIDKTAPVIGMTAGGTFGGSMRLGPDASYLLGESSSHCSSGCAGIGPTLGLVNPHSKEYFAGVAMAISYMGSGWIDVAARFKGDRYSGVHASIAIGWVMMGYAALGYSEGNRRPFLELGATVKWPFL